MDRLKSVSKSGWHPGSSSEPSYAGASDSRSSSTTSRLKKNFKGFDQVAGWMGKGESGTDDGPVNVRPVSALRDPASFGPPPKRIPNAGASSDGFVSQASGEDRGYEDESAKKYSSPKPYRANTTGLSTDTLPLPPKRPNTSIGFGDETSGNRPPPIPPRLAPRGESALPTPRDVVDMKTGGINVTTIGRLGKAGISVPGFNMTPAAAPTVKPPLPSGPRPSASMNSLGDHVSDPRGTPSTGTTFAEKKAALATANSFYKNPSSVSFSDASAALKTGRNFQQRHGDQVASGYKKAQEMGLDKKIQGYGDLYASRNEGGSGGMTTLRVSLPPALPTKNLSPDLPSRPSGLPVPPAPSATISGKPGQGKKKPPPPPKKKPTIPTPPKKQATNTPPHVNLTYPPIIPRGTRPTPSKTPTILQNNGLPLQIFPELPSDLDLCISTAWFSKSPLKLPPPVDGIEEKIHMFTSSWERSASGRTKHTLILAIRWTINLSTTKIKITWDASAPSVTAKAEQKHFPPPSSSPPRSEEWGDRIVGWVRARIGQQVGNGECWTLAADCFNSLKSEDEAIGSKKIMTAQGTSFGLCIFSHYPSLQHKPSVLSGLTLKPGDILQFRSARWIRRDSAGRVISDMRAGAPEGTAGCKDHTAVIETVHYEPGGDIKVGVLQQNSNGVKVVTRGEYTLGAGEMVEGGVRTFRAVADGWADLEAGW